MTAYTNTAKKHGYVYAIRDESGRYKFGHTKDIEQRKRQLQTGNADILRIVYTLEVEDMIRAETALHTLFAAQHKHGEWFKLTTDDEYMLVQQIFKASPTTDKIEKYLRMLNLR